MRVPCALLVTALFSCAAEAPPSPSVTEDAVSIYRALNKQFPKLPDCVRKAFDGEKIDIAEVDAAIASYDSLLEQLARATRAPGCSWTYTGTLMLTVDYPLDYVLIAARLLSVRAGRRLERGALPNALEDLKVLSIFGNHLQQDRPVVGNLLGMICVTWACDSLRAWNRDGRLDRPALEFLEAHFRLLAQRTATFDTLLRNERNAAISLIDEIINVGLFETLRRFTKEVKEEKDEPWIVRGWETWVRDTLKKDPERAKRVIAERWDEHLARLSPYCRGPLNSRPKTFEQDDVSQDVKKRMGMHALGLGAGGDDALKDVGDLLFMLWVPGLAKIPRHFAIARLYPELTRLGCTLELHRLKTGSYPERLGDVCEVPEDPFDGGTLKYRRVSMPEGEGFVLAAAGPDTDHEARIHHLIDACAFDATKFEEKYGETAAYTFGVFRRR
jgi:hypothetical protein